MSDIVLDSSAVVALMRGETGADTVADYLGRAAISSVNLAEAYGRLLRESFRPDELRKDFETLELDVHPFNLEQAYVAGYMEPATRKAGLSLGDRACLALAATLGIPALTGDGQWRKVKIDVEVRLFR